MLGWELRRVMERLGPLVALDRKEVDLVKEADLRTTIRRVRPTLLINAAGYTSVDRADGERELCWNVNAVAPRVMAEEASRLQATLLHLSTDYVFDGRKQSPYDELQARRGQSALGRSTWRSMQIRCCSPRGLWRRMSLTTSPRWLSPTCMEGWLTCDPNVKAARRTAHSVLSNRKVRVSSTSGSSPGNSSWAHAG